MLHGDNYLEEGDVSVDATVSESEIMRPAGG
jgi:hypothetical protein